MIKGGLGNQMSQYAFYLNLIKLHDADIYPLDMCFNFEHNGLELNKIFPNINKKFIRSPIIYIVVRLMATSRFPLVTLPLKFILNILGVNCINESYSYEYNKTNCRAPINTMLYLGGWHSDKYFEKVGDEIKNIFEFDESLLDVKNMATVNYINNCNSVSIHIRRGDYYTVGKNIFGEICNKEYYLNAMIEIERYVENPRYIIFSDDISWVKENLNINGRYIDFNISNDSWRDMYLMSKCKHNIICNSSFSWWGAWLNQNEGKIVVCPSRFINSKNSSDIFPEKWIKINV